VTERTANTLISGLRHCVSWLDLVLGRLHEGVVVVDDRMDVVYVNQPFATLLSADRLNIVGQPLSRLLPLSEAELGRFWIEFEEAGGTGHRYLGDYALGPSILEIWASPLDGGGGMRQLIFMVLDVTQRREAETRQQQHESELARVNQTLEERVRRRTFELEALYELSTQISAATNPEDVLRMVLECLFQVQRQDVSGALLSTESCQQVILKITRPVTDRFLDRTTDLMSQAMEQLAPDPIDLGRLTRQVVQAERYDPSVPALNDLAALFQAPLTCNGAIVGMLLAGSGRRRRYAENEVRFLYTLAAHFSGAMERLGAARAEERRRLDQMVRNLPSGLILLDRERRLVFANAEAHRLLDTLPSIGEVVETVGPIAVATVLEQGVPMEFERSRPRQILSLSTAASEAETVVFVRDVTREREEQQRVAMQERLAVVGQLAGGVAHDFNNLLNVILGYSELILSQINASEPLFGDIQEIQNAGERAAMLTRQLLAFSRRQLLIPKVFGLNEVVADMEKLLRRLIGEHIVLVTVLDPDLGAVRADPGQIEQVIMNLAVNARDAMPEGGRLTIKTSSAELDDKYSDNHVAVRPGRYVLLAVSDTGIGMDEETQERIFEPFFTTKEQHKGTGLGLATVYGIVKQSGGNIWVDSELGAGTTFQVYLPQVEGAWRHLQVVPDPAVDRQGTETILLVEDETEVRTLVARVLREHGYKVLTAPHGGEAIEMCRNGLDGIDLLMTDVVMPGMSGRELAEHLVAQNSRLKVLYMSGYTDDAIFRQGILDRGAPFVQKPFSTDTLTAKVREVLG
jgi:signal transduction histidine kinase